jgi:hypothetical protein
MKTIDALKSAKEAALKEILGSTDMSDLEKLTHLHQNDLWGFSDWVNDEFPEWQKECIDLEIQATIDDGKDPEKEYVCKITDTVFDPSWADHGRGESVSYIDIIENYVWDFEYSNKENKELLAEYKETGRIPESETMVVVTNRGDYNSEVVKPVQEVIDRLCEFCMKEKIIGYTNDW